MKISTLVIEEKIKKKILNKHDIKATEIKEILLNNPYVLRVREGRYMAIGFCNRYITIIFELEKDNKAFIVTAYTSSDSQRKLFKRKKQ